MSQSAHIAIDGDEIVFEEAARPFGLQAGIGGSQISLNVRVQAANDHTPERPYRVSATMLLGRTMNSCRWLGELHAGDLVTVRRGTQTLTLRGFVSDAQLRAAEEYRGDADELWISLQISMTGVSPNVNTVRLVGSRASLDFPISSGDWLKAWEQAQSGAYLEVLVPLPGDVEYAKAVERLREARGLIHGDKAEEAVSKARLAIEPVRRAYGTAPAAARALKKENKRDRDKDERWALLVENLFDLTSGAVHDDPNITERFEWTREEAVAVVAATAGLLGRFAADRQANALGE